MGVNCFLKTVDNPRGVASNPQPMSAHGALHPTITLLQTNNVHSFQRPDATSLTYDPARTSMNGYGGNLAVSKIGG